jgi:predicted hotdog family 3-hydroxylacyl-ACP dehydratase
MSLTRCSRSTHRTQAAATGSDVPRMTTAPIPDPPGALRLPHAYPFRLLDRAVVLESGGWAFGLKNLTRGDPLVDAEGALAPVLLAEMMAQAAGLAAAAGSKVASPAVLARIDRFRCSPPIIAGDHLLVAARVVRRFGATVQVRASVTAAGRRCAAAELVLQFAQALHRDP